MRQIRSILYPTDFSRCSVQALDHALFLAEHFDARLHMLHAIVLHADDHLNPAYHFPEPEEIYQRLDSLAASEMRKLLEGGDRKVEIVHVRERGIAAGAVILDYAAEQDVDLIVMGTHGRRGPRRFFLGSVAEEVVRHAPMPVMTLREREEPRRLEALESILMPVDFSRESRSALAVARELASHFGARLDVLHVIEELVYPSFYGTVEGWGLPVTPEELLERARQALEELLEEGGGPEVSWEVLVASGRPARTIVEQAGERGSDLVVIASQGLTGLDRVVFGSTAEHVLRMAECPVLTLRTGGD